jgi:hypothetical protein
MVHSARDLEAQDTMPAVAESRRSLLRRSVAAAAAAAAGAVAVQATLRPSDAGAANGQAVKLGVVNTATLQTAVNNSAVGGRALNGRASSTTPSSGSVGVFGQSDARLGSGVYGVGHNGVIGRGPTTFPNATGVVGLGVYGVDGRGTNTGVKGQGGPVGVWGGGSGSLSMGVYGAGDYGVYGLGNYNANSWGVYGRGPYGVVADGSQVGVTGTGPRGVQGNGVGAGGAGVFAQGDYGVYARGNYNANSWGVYGTGVYGVVGGGAAWGVYGTAPYGVVGKATSGAPSYGVYGDGARGVVGVGIGSGAQGVYGNGTYGVVSLGAIVGVQGEANGSVGTGVFGIGGPNNGYGGFFRGNVGTSGAYYSGVPGFARIDHPLDPANRYLVHAAVHSPEMLNVYGGTVTLGRRGTATVRLPRYDGALNGNHRVQLTAVGAAAPNLHVVSAVANGRFTIAGGSAGQSVYWQVTGVRQDVVARKHPVKVEALKRPTDRGKYLAPELYGRSQSDRIGPDVARLSRRERRLTKGGGLQPTKGPATLAKVRRVRSAS